MSRNPSTNIARQTIAIVCATKNVQTIPAVYRLLETSPANPSLDSRQRSMYADEFENLPLAMRGASRPPVAALWNWVHGRCHPNPRGAHA
jgi:hypothetical protein